MYFGFVWGLEIFLEDLGLQMEYVFDKYKNGVVNDTLLQFDICISYNFKDTIVL